MQIQISWLLQKPTDLDLHCLLRKGMSCLARDGLSWEISHVLLLKYIWYWNVLIKHFSFILAYVSHPNSLQVCIHLYSLICLLLFTYTFRLSLDLQMNVSPADVPRRSKVFLMSQRRRNDAFITKTCLYNTDPLIPHFYIVKLGFSGVYIIFLISAQKHRLWVLVRTASARRF